MNAATLADLHALKPARRSASHDVGHLVLRRRPGDEVVIVPRSGAPILVRLLEHDRPGSRQAKLSFLAEPEVALFRREVLDAMTTQGTTPRDRHFAQLALTILRELEAHL